MLRHELACFPVAAESDADAARMRAEIEALRASGEIDAISMAFARKAGRRCRSGTVAVQPLTGRSAASNIAR